MQKGQLCLAALLASTTIAPHAHAVNSQPPGAPTATTVKLPSGPGSVRGLAGDPSVSVFTGQASYAVPLELPSAARGFAPRVELQYRGDLGNGSLGIGWGIAMPKIVRSTRQGVPNYLATDELELAGVGAGGRLVSIGTGEWRIEGQGNAVRVVQTGSGYTVWGPDGTQYALGTTAAARQESAGKIAAWHVEQVTDVAGQVVTYEYTKDQNEIYPNRITWGPPHTFAAVFEMEARPDVITSYALGFAVTTSRRIAAVRAEAFGEVQRRYDLDYEEGFSVSRLRTVQLTGRGGAPAPTTTFTYAQRPIEEAQLLGAGNWRLDSSTVLVDVDGDGAADLLRLTSLGHSYRQNRAGQFTAPIAMTGAAGATLSTSRLADVEGRARANLVTSASDGWRPYRIAGNSWQALGTWSGTSNVPLSGSNVVFADLDGDNRVDVIEWNAVGLIVRFANATGLDAPVSKPKIGGTLLPSANVRWHDVNGDGLSDAVLVSSNSLAAYYGRGDGTFTTPQSFAWPWGGSLGTSDIRFADLDRDGLLDLVKINNGDVAWYRGKAGGGFITQAVLLPRPPDADSSVIVAIDDANGNGSADVVWSAPSGMRVLDLAGATTAGMLVAIDNGLGKTIAITYDATTAIAGRDADAGVPWTWHLPIAIPVVTKMVTASGAGDPERTIDFTLRDGFWDAAENRFGGFLLGKRFVRGGGVAPDLVEETRFHSGTGTTRVLRGMPVTVRVENGAGNLESMTTNTWRALRVLTLPDTPLLRKAVLDRTVVDQGTITTRVNYTLDGEGRTIGEYNEGRIDLSGDEYRIERTFADDSVLWVRDLIAEEKRLATDGTILSWLRNYYGDHLSEAPLGAAGRGWQRRVEGSLGGAFVTREAREYDALGNPTKIVLGGVEHRIEYDANGLHATREVIGTDTGELAWTSEWDLVLGMMTARTGPDGITQRVTYDGLGRLTSESVGNRPAHVHYKYLWKAPRPRTETYLFDGALANVTALPATWSPGNGWRKVVSVTNGAGESLYAATALDTNRWIVDAWTERDAMGRAVFLGEAAEVATVSPIISTRPTGMLGQTIRRDALGRVIEQTLANGSIRQIAYAPFSTTTTSAGLAPVIVTRDGLDRPIETRRESELARARYDAAGRATAFEIVRGSDVIVHGFSFDTLGRLVTSTHPDGGERTFEYDAGDRVTRETNATGQSIVSTYDTAGRLVSRAIDDGAAFAYHYDTTGRLDYVDEPSGRATLGYDELGNITRRARTIDGVTGAISITYATSGLVLSQSFDDDAYVAAHTYDPAGRLVRIGDLWQGISRDAAGRLLRERFGNNVEQITARDALGLPSAISIGSLYNTVIDRNAWGAITGVTDTDGVGLDHSATFTYDTRRRLTSATAGSGVNQLAFTFAYDDVQNMTARSAPQGLGVMTGTYNYDAVAKRRLVSITDGVGSHTFAYDAAGRQTGVDAKQLSFDALDQLTSADTLAHAYGYEGERIKTTRPDGSIARFFTPEITETDGGREYVVGADSAIARVRVAESEKHASLAIPTSSVATGALVLAIVALCGFAARRKRLRGALVLFVFSCGSPTLGEKSQATTTTVVYFHQTIAPGPTLFTDADGHVTEERRHDPFGAPIEAADFRSLDRGILGKPVDSTTGWSFHGARWFQPESARWLSVDPATRMPDAGKFMAEPWSLHPYQYVDQNPVVYWDPDGRDKSPIVDVQPEKRGQIRKPFTELDRYRVRRDIARRELDEAKQKVSEAFDRGRAADGCERLIWGCGRALEHVVNEEIDTALDEAFDALSRLKRAERDLERAQRREDRQRPSEGCELGCPAPTTPSRSSSSTKKGGRPVTVPDEPTYERCEPSEGCKRTIIIDLNNGDLSGGTRHDDD